MSAKNRLLMLVTWVVVAGCVSAPSKPEIPPGAEAPSDGCDTPLGFIPEGGSASGYLHQTDQSGQSCQQGTIECRDGTWSGAYIYPSCTRLPK